MKNILFRNWGAARIIRLLAGLGFVIFGILTGNMALPLLGALFAFQALINTS